MAPLSKMREPYDPRLTIGNEYNTLILKLRWIGLEQEATRLAAQFKTTVGETGENMLTGTD